MQVSSSSISSASSSTVYYSQAEQNCLNDIEQLKKDWEGIKDPSSPTDAELIAIAMDINRLSFDQSVLATSPLTRDQDFANNINAYLLQVPFGPNQATLQQAAKACTPPDDVDLMRQTYNVLYLDGSYSSYDAIMIELLEDPFSPPWLTHSATLELGVVANNQNQRTFMTHVADFKDVLNQAIAHPNDGLLAAKVQKAGALLANDFAALQNSSSEADKKLAEHFDAITGDDLDRILLDSKAENPSAVSNDIYMYSFMMNVADFEAVLDHAVEHPSDPILAAEVQVAGAIVANDLENLKNSQLKANQDMADYFVAVTGNDLNQILTDSQAGNANAVSNDIYTYSLQPGRWNQTQKGIDSFNGEYLG